MKAEQRPWTIHLQAKAKHFHFKLKATKYLPACYSFFQFSLLLKISHLLIRVRSDNNQTRRNSMKSKSTRVIEKFRSRLTNRKTFVDHKPSKIKRSKPVSPEVPVRSGTVVIGNLALLIQSIYEKDTKGIIIHCLSIFLYIVRRIKTFIGTKSDALLLASIVAMVGYPLWLHTQNHSSYDERTLASRYIRKVWNWAAQVT